MLPWNRFRDSGNRILDRLPPEEYDSIAPLLQRNKLALRQVVQQFEADVDRIHFPTTALTSLLTVLEDDEPVESATVGREGFIGVSASLGIAASPHRVICQMDGDTLSLPVPAFLEAMARGPALTRLIHHFIAYMFRSTGQGTACNALHLVEARTCRWLLLTHDQVGRDEFPLTQEFLAFMLGVRRQGVTVIAGTLQRAGMITYRRGTITILDRPMLEEAACECYAANRAYYDRVMG